MSDKPDPVTLTDDELRHAFIYDDGEAGDPYNDALAEEVERRDLDI